MKRSLISVLLVASAFAANASDAPKSVAKGDAARGQPVAAAVCGACHGADGNSIIPMNPKLAGQHPEYLFKQMKEFKAVDGKPADRASAIMKGMIAAFDENQMRDFAAYFASNKQTPAAETKADANPQGRKLYLAGDLEKGLPACAACHGPTGAGIPAQFPRIGGQFSEYTEAQLKAFRDGARANDVNKMMRTVALKMTDAEIKAVSSYIAGLR
jgi:cytochrome c553